MNSYDPLTFSRKHYIYDLYYYSIGCSARSHRSNHVPQCCCGFWVPNYINLNFIIQFFFQGECQRDEDCTDQEACESYYCINPCKSDTCERDFFCKVKRHVPVCGRKYVAEPQEVLQNTINYPLFTS
jgi:hypothetical protein